MKTPEEMAEYFRSMPSKKRENPYWIFENDPPEIKSRIHMMSPGAELKPLNLKVSKPLLITVREFFRRYCESFHTEAQVLCVTPDDGVKLAGMGIPKLAEGQIGSFEVAVMVLPQDNSMGNTVVSEWFWQAKIVDAGIVPVARIHSHHILEPYQSNTDYSTLNSGTLEMVMGKIYEEKFYLCYWLDVPGTDIKAQTFLAQENDFGDFAWIPHKFHGAGADLMTRDGLKTFLNTGVRAGEGVKQLNNVLKQQSGGN